ncbi:adenine deaminase [Microbacterium xylanilyticum]
MHDLRVSGGTVVSVATGEMWRADVLIDGATITALIEPGSMARARDQIDARGLLVVPGFIDAHVHVESSMLVPATFAQATLARGTTTVLADPHEIVNVAGAKAMRWMVSEGSRTQQSMFWAVPSCVPSLDGMETAGAILDAAAVDELLALPGVVALGELMDYRAVVAGAERMEEILAVARRRGVIVDGHCPNLDGDELQRYLLAGVDSDHCKNDAGPFGEKLRLGMTLMLQEKSFTAEVIAALDALPYPPDLCIVTDDIAADVIARDGHLDHVARVARGAGMAPITVLRALTINPARRLRLHDRGIVAPGRRADLVLITDLDEFRVQAVVVGGRRVHEQPAPTRRFTGSIRIGAGSLATLDWTTDLPDGMHLFRAIRVNPVDTSTRADTISLPVRDGVVQWEGHCARVTVIERHEGSGRVAHAPVLGMEIAPGAVATTYAHDSHNLTVIGTSTEWMMAAVVRAVEIDGGIVVRARTGDAELALPIGGVMTDAPLPEVAAATGRIREALKDWGWNHRIPFMSISTLTLPVSPELKISDYGLIDVLARGFVTAAIEPSDRHD